MSTIACHMLPLQMKRCQPTWCAASMRGEEQVLAVKQRGGRTTLAPMCVRPKHGQSNTTVTQSEHNWMFKVEHAIDAVCVQNNLRCSNMIDDFGCVPYMRDIRVHFGTYLRTSASS